jgi:uncharacterized protein
MQIEFDRVKDRLNREKHQIGLDAAVEIFASSSVQWTSLRDGSGEPRIVAVGLVEGREFTCIFTMRGQVARIISVRRARHEERDRFWKIRRAQNRSDDDNA